MLTLALDTSSEFGSLALGSNGNVLETRSFQGSMRHSTTLFPALAELNLPALKINRIIVGLGPGSFSGIRVAISAAYGIALPLQAEVVGICSAWSVAYQLAHVPHLGVFADARRGEWYCTSFRNGQMDRSTYLLPRSESSATIKEYDLAVSAEPMEGISQRVYPRAQDFLIFPEDSPVFVRQNFLEPIYLREPTISPPSS